ncbi:MAG: hypothetical protein NTZ72_03170 [Afipia sp.]|nr:hypothetical protein [Afipia sp.]
MRGLFVGTSPSKFAAIANSLDDFQEWVAGSFHDAHLDLLSRRDRLGADDLRIVIVDRSGKLAIRHARRCMVERVGERRTEVTATGSAESGDWVEMRTATSDTKIFNRRMS